MFSQLIDTQANLRATKTENLQLKDRFQKVCLSLVFPVVFGSVDICQLDYLKIISRFLWNFLEE